MEVAPRPSKPWGWRSTRCRRKNVLDAYEEYEYKQEEAQDLGHGVLFVVGRLGGRPAGGAGWVQERWCYTVTWAAEMIVRVVLSQDIEKARAAAERLAESRA